MSKNVNSSSHGRAVLEQASEYYLALQDNSMSGAELRSWQKWFLRSKEHQRSFRHLEALWGALDALSITDFEEKGLKGSTEADDSADAPANSGSIIGLVAGGKPEADAALNTNMFGTWATAIAASVAVVAMTGYMFLAPEGASIKPPVSVYQSSIDQQRVVTLTDGSILELGPNSEVDVQYSAAERRMTLVRGQAIFTVSKNPNRPFVVRAGKGSVTALGTVFNVRKLGTEVQVRVLEGTVAVRPSPAVPQLDATAVIAPAAFAPVALVTAGLQTQYNEKGALAPVEEADVRDGLGWRVGILKMVNRELSGVVQELNRFMENEITIGDEAIGHFRFTGTVYPDQVNDWLAGLQQGYPLKVVRVGSSIVLMPEGVPAQEPTETGVAARL
ncbi:MAG: FecR domain-containing protein [Kordiimonadaceae bacterium]|nr:FecR domain-containing protein [Kordiimonadaceae bacterium]